MQTIKKLYLILIITILVIIALIFLIINTNSTPTAQVIVEPNTYSFTKAICENNVCIDYTIACKGGNVTSITPVSDPVELPPAWQDPRTQEDIDKLCE